MLSTPADKEVQLLLLHRMLPAVVTCQLRVHSPAKLLVRYERQPAVQQCCSYEAAGQAKAPCKGEWLQHSLQDSRQFAGNVSIVLAAGMLLALLSAAVCDEP